MKDGEWKVGNGRKTDLFMGWDTVIGTKRGEKYVIARTNANYPEEAKKNAVKIAMIPELIEAIIEIYNVPGIVDAMPVYMWDAIESIIERLEGEA